LALTLSINSDGATFRVIVHPVGSKQKICIVGIAGWEIKARMVPSSNSIDISSACI